VIFAGLSGGGAEQRNTGTDSRVGITIRACTEDDVGTLREIALGTFRETFGTMNTVETMENYVSGALARQKLLDELRTPGSTFFFMHSDETLLGYLKTNVGPAQSDAVDPQALEIERIYIRKGCQGSGLGRRSLKLKPIRWMRSSSSCPTRPALEPEG
jgi:hypothetical protein